MKVKQVRVAQALRGETSNLLEQAKYDMTFDKGMLDVKLKGANVKGIGPFKVFPANIAWMEYEEEASPVKTTEITPLVTPQETPAPESVKKPSRASKK